MHHTIAWLNEVNCTSCQRIDHLNSCVSVAFIEKIRNMTEGSSLFRQVAFTLAVLWPPFLVLFTWISIVLRNSWIHPLT